MGAWCNKAEDSLVFGGVGVFGQRLPLGWFWPPGMPDAYPIPQNLQGEREGGQTRLTSQVRWEQVPLTTVHFLSNRKKRF